MEICRKNFMGKMVKKYTFEELLDLSYGEEPWWQATEITMKECFIQQYIIK